MNQLVTRRAIPLLTEGTVVPISLPLPQQHLLRWSIGNISRVSSTYQPYAHGVMMWRSDTRNIFVILYNGRCAVYEDSYNAGEELTCLSPFSALVFGKIYCSNPEVQVLLGERLALESDATLVVQVYSTGSILETLNTGLLVLLPETELIYC